MWLNTIAKKFIENGDGRKIKRSFKCPLRYGWVFGNEKNYNNTNFVPLLMRYTIDLLNNKPLIHFNDVSGRYKYYSKNYDYPSVNEIEDFIKNQDYQSLFTRTGTTYRNRDYYWYRKICENVIEVSILAKISEDQKIFSHTMLYKFMKQYGIKTIYFYDSQAEKIEFDSTDDTIDIISILPQKLVIEINNLSKYMSYFNTDCEITADFDHKFLLTRFKFNINRFLQSYMANNILSFANMFRYYLIDNECDNDFYTDMLSTYSSKQEYVNEVIIPCKDNKERKFYIECFEKAFLKKFDINDYL